MSERDESNEQQGSGPAGEQSGGESEARQKAREAEQEHEEAKEKVKELEENPPEKLDDWPTGPAMYESFGGPEGEHTYDEGPERKLGPSSLRHHEGGDVSIEGEKVDEP